LGKIYPRKWLKQIESKGIDIGGIQNPATSLDLRAFYAYNEKFEITHGTPVSQFARRELTFPNPCSGYQAPTENRKDVRMPNLVPPIPMEIPSEYLRRVPSIFVLWILAPIINSLLPSKAGSVYNSYPRPITGLHDPH